MSMMDKDWHRRHPDFTSFDRIELEVVPRYKTSGLSGDEWRTGVRAKFFFKGEVVHESTFGDMHVAMMVLPHTWLEAQSPIPERIMQIEKTMCDQPGCSEDFVSKFRLKRLTSDSGEYLDPADQHLSYFRQFCRKHLRRGDCGREDSDANYELISGPGPGESSNTEESPAVFGGVIDLEKK